MPEDRCGKENYVSTINPSNYIHTHTLHMLINTLWPCWCYYLVFFLKLLLKVNQFALFLTHIKGLFFLILFFLLLYFCCFNSFPLQAYDKNGTELFHLCDSLELIFFWNVYPKLYIFGMKECWKNLSILT